VFENQCSAKGLQFRLEHLPPPGARVVGDVGKLRQILINLVSNAVKFTPAGVVAVRFEGGPDDEYVFSVTDTGAGIPDGAFEEVLLPFHQESAGRSVGGTGLGLAIAHRYAALMGARLSIGSKLGEGSTVSLAIRLPGSTVARTPVPRGWRLPADVPITALVADDVAENREVLATMLEGFGCRVTHATSGSEALAGAATTFQPAQVGSSIVFLDVRMPDIDGLGVVKRLREGPLRGLRIVAHSASALAHEQAEYVRAGFDDFLAKPVSYDEVRRCLARLPGVSLEPGASTPSEQPSHGTEAPEAAQLPTALRDRIRQAADSHNATVLRSCLREVEELGLPQRPRLERLRRAMQAYDMKAIAGAVSSDASR
jgi:CheY-like chemotaxis protein